MTDQIIAKGMMSVRQRTLAFRILLWAGVILAFAFHGRVYAKNTKGIQISHPRKILIGEKTKVKVSGVRKGHISFRMNRKGKQRVRILKQTKNSILLQGKAEGKVKIVAHVKGRKVLKTEIEVVKTDRKFRLDQTEITLDNGDYGKIIAAFGDECVSRQTKWTVSDKAGLYLGTFDATGEEGFWEANTVYGIEPGTYYIRAFYRGRKASCKVVVRQTSKRWLELCESRERTKKCRKAIKKAFKKSIKSGMNDLEKAKALAEWLCGYLEYDDSLESNSYEDALAYGTAACEGYAEAYNVLLREAGIRSCIVHGKAYTRKKSKKALAHAWNLIYIDDEWFHVDVTWMDRGSKISYKSFMKSTSYFGKKRPKRRKWKVEYYNFPELIIWLHERPETGNKFDKISGKKWKNGKWKKLYKKMNK